MDKAKKQVKLHPSLIHKPTVAELASQLVTEAQWKADRKLLEKLRRGEIVHGQKVG